MARSSTTFNRKWNAGKTCVIRVPETLSSSVLAYARKLDNGEQDFVGEYQGEFTLTSEPMRKELDYSTPVNVASVPQRSPFRYPGGKTWLIPILRQWLKSLPSRPRYFIEPFGGGAIASLTVAFEHLAEHAVFSEIEGGVAAVWNTILTGQAEWLAGEILKFELTEANARKRLNKDTKGHGVTLREKAFLTILRNRVQRGGIMAPGAGLIKTGENGKGTASRWYPETLAKRIRAIAEQKHRLSFYPVDGFKLIQDYTPEKEAVFFLDPPYTVAAKRLYDNWQIDHRRLFEVLSDVKGDFLITYDDTEEVRNLADEFGYSYDRVAMKSTHHAKKNELLISRRLDWF